MKRMGKANVVQIAMQKVNDVAGGMLSLMPQYRVVKTLVDLYVKLQDGLYWLKMLRHGPKPLNEWTLEGLYRKKVEIFYFDFLEPQELEGLKTVIRGLVSSVFLTLVFYLLSCYFMNLSLVVRLSMCCVLSTVLVMTLSFSQPARVVMFLAIPTMAQGNVKSAILVAAVILAAAGPAYNIRSNTNAIIETKQCLNDEVWEVRAIAESLVHQGDLAMAGLTMRLLQLVMELVVEAVYRILFLLAHALDKMFGAMLNKYKAIRKMLARLTPSFSFSGGCFRVMRMLVRKFRHQKLLGGIVQCIVKVVDKLFVAKGSPPLAKPTIGYIVQKYGIGKVCPLLLKARQLKKRMKEKVMEKLKELLICKEEYGSIMELLLDMARPDSRLVIRMSGGMKHHLHVIKNLIRQAVRNKTIDLHNTQKVASRILQIASSFTVILLTTFSIGMSIRFYVLFMKKDNFENIYITFPFIRLDELEAPVLPLDNSELRHVSVLSDPMITNLIDQLKIRVLIFAVIRIIPFFLVLFAEMSTFAHVYVMETAWNGVISVERSMDTKLNVTDATKQVTNPLALAAKLFVVVQRALSSIEIDVNMLNCAPQAARPKFAINMAIVGMCMVYMVLALFSPFFLKLRHNIMVNMFPVRAVQRAVWLRRHIEEERQLMPGERDAKKMKQLTQTAKSQGTLQQLYQHYVEENFQEWMDTLRSLFNLPTVTCAECGIRGNLSLPNFNEFFTVCDSCGSHLCVRCMHVESQEFGLSQLRTNCPVCDGEIAGTQIDEEQIEDADPLNQLLYDLAHLRPDYRVGPTALAEHLDEIQQHKAEEARREERSVARLLSPGGGKDPTELMDDAKEKEEEEEEAAEAEAEAMTKEKK